MFDTGDIVAIYSPIAGKRKYHLCLQPAGQDDFCHFSFLNSDATFSDFSVECEAVPCLPPSTTDRTAFSFTLLSRFTAEKPALFEAKKLGILDPVLAENLLAFAETARFLTRPDKNLICNGLRTYIALHSGPTGD